MWDIYTYHWSPFELQIKNNIAIRRIGFGSRHKEGRLYKYIYTSWAHTQQFMQPSHVLSLNPVGMHVFCSLVEPTYPEN